MAALVLGLASPASPEPLITESLNLFGTPGLLQMPSAEMQEDAQITASVTRIGDQMRNTLTFQIAPRVTGSFRYSRFTGYYADGDDLFDRSFDLKFQLLDEGQYRPAVAVGLQDFLGTGIYSGEYIVATKSVLPNLRVSAGLGWGGLAKYGGLGFSDAVRDAYVPGEEGGDLNAGSWFKGDAAVFGGISWKASDRLTLKAEYSTAGYDDEAGNTFIEPESAWNFGVDYRVRDNVHVQAAYLRGSEMAVQLSFSANPRKPAAGAANENAPLPVGGRPARRSDPDAWSQNWAADSTSAPAIRRVLSKAMAKEGVTLESLAVSGTRAEVRYRNNRYGAEPQAIGRTARIMTRALPASVETFVLVPVSNGVPRSKVTLKRSDLEALEQAPSSAILARARVEDAAGPAPANLVAADGQYPRFTWSISPSVTFSAFDPDEPVRGQLGVQFAAQYDISPGLVLSGAIVQKLAGNIEDSDQTSNSVLQHVRSDAALYAAEGETAISHLTLAHYGRPGPDLYSRLTAGLLEPMFAGVSGEVLWKPVDSRLAFGAEVNWVKQRDYDQQFSFLDYEVVTGHASAYYAFGNGFHGTLDVGRYLAGDWGATLAIDREFANGWRIGAYVTKTDVTAEEFGEGSYDKGIRITVPLSYFNGKPTRAASSTVLRSLSRDGGAKLSVNGRLYDTVREAHEPDLEASWGRFWR